MRAAFCLLVCIGCVVRPGDTPRDPNAAPDAEAQTAAPEPAAAIPAEVERLIAAALAPYPAGRRDYPACPPLTDELKRGVAAELSKTPALKGVWERLAPEKSNVTQFDAVEELKAAGASFSLAANLCHNSDDVKIKSARALGALRDRAPAPFMLAVAAAFAVFEDGSENATIHGILQHALAEALNAITGAKVTLGHSQDPEGLRAGIAIWERALAP
jgi:hypothetical protein